MRRRRSPPLVEVLQVNFDYRRLQSDIRLKAPQIVALFYKHYGVEMTNACVYAWFNKGCIPLERLIQLLTVVRIETNRKLDLWRYIDVPLTRKVA